METNRVKVNPSSRLLHFNLRQSYRVCSSLDKSTVRPDRAFPDPFVYTFPIIPGTTGYEEAAAQGVVAGINAGLAAQGRLPLILTRADGFTGVMIDDLIVKGAEEPCMLTATCLSKWATC